MTPVDAVGWTASALLFATVSRQVWTQWKSGTDAGVSRWLFIGQMAASAGFAIYSWLLDNWIFVVSNVFMFCAAIAGELVRRRVHAEAPAGRRATEA